MVAIYGELFKTVELFTQLEKQGISHLYTVIRSEARLILFSGSYCRRKTCIELKLPPPFRGAREVYAMEREKRVKWITTQTQEEGETDNI